MLGRQEGRWGYETDGDPRGERAVEITERGRERVETNGRGRRRTHEENSCRARNSPCVSREGAQGGEGEAKDYRTKRSFAEFHEACVLTCQRGIGATFPTFLPDKSAVIRSDGFHLCESPQS